jgi:very-short-patch-repair endonuclease
MSSAVNTPSSDPSGHLLPVGEKGKRAAMAIRTSAPPVLIARRKDNGSADIPFSPTGRRWPEGSDEGGMPNANDITRRRPGKTGQARRLRRIETEEERHLWGDLRGRRFNGFKFARQMPLGAYVVDFLCRDRRLIVEIDGFHHAASPSDEARTSWLNSQGYSVLRFWNHEITQERRAVLDTILAALTGQITERCHAARFYPGIPEKTGEQP